MHTPTAAERFEALDDPWSVDEYNFDHFGPQHILFDVKQIVTTGGVQPGAPAPDFELPRVGGGTVRLSDLRDQPTLLHFGSFT